MRFFPNAAVCLALCLAAARGYGLDPALQEARLSLMAADSAGVARAYAAWLDANSSSAAAPLIFQRYLDTEGSVSSLLESSRKFLKAATKGAFLPQAFVRIARLFEVAGMTEEARDAYLSAYAHGAPVSALESAFLLSFEMNDGATLQSALTALKDTPGDTADLLAASLSYAKGDAGPAGAALMRIASSTSDQSLALKALWLRYCIAVGLGDGTARRDSATLIRTRFPKSPESALTAADDPSVPAREPGAVTLMALPGSFLSGQPAPLPVSQQSPAAQPSPAGSSDPAHADTGPGPAMVVAPAPAFGSTPAASNDKPVARNLSVQAGSFQMKENADDLAAQLVKSGFAPTLRSDAAQGKLLYRVFAGRGLSADEARALLDKLHQAGFSGFLSSESAITGP